MIVIDANGEYEFVEDTKMLRASAHPVHQARLDLALPQGSWLYAPAAGHQLDRFKNTNKTEAKVEEFQKELKFYLKKYSPEVQEILLQRHAVQINLEISEDALDV